MSQNSYVQNAKWHLHDGRDWNIQQAQAYALLAIEQRLEEIVEILRERAPEPRPANTPEFYESTGEPYDPTRGHADE